MMQWPLTSKMQLIRAHDEEVNRWRGGPSHVYEIDNDNEEMKRLIDSLSSLSTTASSNCNRQQRIHFKCNNQANCKELQNIFESNPSLIKTHFKSILYYCGDMLLDGFGNFLLTSILEKCDALQRYLIINRLGSRIFKASLTLSGSRCIQNFIDLSKDDDRTITLFWKLLKPEVESLSIHLYGNHCLKKLLATKKVFCFPDLILAIIENFKPLCLNRYGSYVIQRCFDLVCETHPIFRMEMVAKLSLDFLELSTTRVGNYAVQYLISKMPAIDLDLLMSSLKSNVVRLACDPFGSNVLESLFMRSENTICIGFIVEEMISNPMKLYKIICDRYGQYCIEKAITQLDVSKEGRLLSKAIVDITPLFAGTIREKRVIKTLHGIWFH